MHGLGTVRRNITGAAARRMLTWSARLDVVSEARKAHHPKLGRVTPPVCCGSQVKKITQFIFWFNQFYKNENNNKDHKGIQYVAYEKEYDEKRLDAADYEKN